MLSLEPRGWRRGLLLPLLLLRASVRPTGLEMLRAPASLRVKASEWFCELLPPHATASAGLLWARGEAGLEAPPRPAAAGPLRAGDQLEGPDEVAAGTQGDRERRRGEHGRGEDSTGARSSEDERGLSWFLVGSLRHLRKRLPGILDGVSWEVQKVHAPDFFLIKRSGRSVPGLLASST
jgi:hypothetical protein